MQIYDLIIVMENYFLIKTLETIIPQLEVKQVISFFVVLLLSLESFILNYFQTDQVLRLILPVMTLFLYTWILNHNFQKNILKVVLCFLNLSIIHIIVILASSLTIGSQFYVFINDYSFMFFLTCLGITIQVAEYILIKNYYKSEYRLSRYSIVASCLSSVITFVMINIILKYYVLGEIPYFLCCIIIFSIILFLFLTLFLCILNTRYYEKSIEQSLKLESYEYENKFIEAITQKTDEYNKLRHDMKNHFEILEKMITASHVQEAKEYMNHISFDPNEQYLYINHLVLNYILNNKIRFAKDQGIDLYCLIIGEPVSFISDVDYSILLGNLLDNAIEATVEAKATKIYIVLSFYDNKVILEVKNKTTDKPKSKRFITIKKDKGSHGFGLKSIEDVVNKYRGNQMIDVKNDVFIQRCVLYEVRIK